MQCVRRFRLICICFVSMSALHSSAAAEGNNVAVISQSGRASLEVNGEPYFVRGAGGNSQLELLAAMGGNSIRTWSTDGLDSLLDEAAKNGLLVTVGFWLGHERHGFDYQNEDAVLKQLNACVEAVEKYKNHPAVLMWAVGNEMEGDGKNPAIWYAVDHIARECKRIDPNHPTMTVIAELGETKAQAFHRYCPNVDILGINSYGGITSVAKRYLEAGGTRPYIITEFGPKGPWEVAETPWGSPIEETSTAKADFYKRGYESAVESHPGMCLGSYAFLWGHKQETTATWFGMLLANGEQTGAVDVMSEKWLGSPPSNRVPSMTALSSGSQQVFKPGQRFTATVDATDPDGDVLKYEWVLRSDSGTIGVGGDFQEAEDAVANAVLSSGRRATVTVPEGGGGYRLFAYVRDGRGGAAVGNIPFRVDAPAKAMSAAMPKLPFTLYGDGASGEPFAASGYMGNAGAVVQTLDSGIQPHAGATCLQVEYNAASDWGGVLWQSPPNDWDGNLPGGLNLSNAKALEFWARGEIGGEVVNFLVGGGGSNPYSDTAKSELANVTLGREWKRYEIPMSGKDFSRVKTGFGWSLAAQGDSVTFYLDDVRYIE